MLKQILSTLLFMLTVITALTQSNGKSTEVELNTHQIAYALEPSIRPFFIIQGTMTRFFKDPDGSFGTSISLGIKYLNRFGVAANVQPHGSDYGRIDYVPVSLELSYTAEKHKIRPFANMQIGHEFSGNRYSSSSGDQKVTSQTKGTAFFSPGVGLLFPVKKQSGILLTISYVQTGYKTNMLIASPGGTVRVLSREEFSGYRLGVGFKF